MAKANCKWKTNAYFILKCRIELLDIMLSRRRSWENKQLVFKRSALKVVSSVEGQDSLIAGNWRSWRHGFFDDSTLVGLEVVVGEFWRWRCGTELGPRKRSTEIGGNSTVVQDKRSHSFTWGTEQFKQKREQWWMENSFKQGGMWAPEPESLTLSAGMTLVPSFQLYMTYS